MNSARQQKTVRRWMADRIRKLALTLKRPAMAPHKPEAHNKT